MHTMEDYTRGFQVPVRHQREKPDHRWIQIYTRWFQTHWFQTHWFQTHWFQTDTSLALCNGTTLVADLDEEKKKEVLSDTFDAGATKDKDLASDPESVHTKR